jgi:ABC-type nitrate/sulfonate/bicarbonate transport system permease component
MNQMLQKYTPPLVLLPLLVLWSVDRWTAVCLLLALAVLLLQFREDEA